MQVFVLRQLISAYVQLSYKGTSFPSSVHEERLHLLDELHSYLDSYVSLQTTSFYPTYSSFHSGHVL